MRPALRFLGLLLGFCAVALAAVTLLNRYEVPYSILPQEMGVNMPLRIQAARLGFGMKRRVVVLGDSTTIAAPAGGILSDRLQQSLDAPGRPRSLVQNLATYGASPFEYYVFARRLAASRPDLVVFAINLQAFSQEWRQRWARNEVYGWVETSRFLEALELPLHTWGITLDTMLMYRAFVVTGAVDTWLAVRKEQVRAGSGLTTLRSWLQRSVEPAVGGRAKGLPESPSPFLPGNSKRFRRARLEQLYSAALAGVRPDHPLLQLLRAELRELRRAGVPVLLYAVPSNLEHMRKVGLTDLQGLRSTANVLCSVAREEGATCLDLHDRFGDDWFADPGGHFTTAPGKDGMKRLADLLTPTVVQMLSTKPTKDSHAVQ